MAESINKIFTRMKRIPYQQRWLFKKPKQIPNFIGKSYWLSAMTTLIQDTILPLNTNNLTSRSSDMDFQLSSVMDSELNMSDD